MRRGVGVSEAAMSIGAMGMVLMTLVAIDPRVREQLSLRISRPSVQLTQASQQVQDLTTVVTGALREQSIEHAPLLIFVLVAAVLVLFMTRT